jgi:RNA-directed DNA polymerase
MPEAKPYVIPKQLVWEAYKRVKANRGAAGVDGETLAAFEKDLKGNLYKVWNRMSSGSYFPPPVRLVEIPKANGGKRPLGIPTVADRVAQTVVKMRLEPLVEPKFHPDSYGNLRWIESGARRGRHGETALLGRRLGYRFGHQSIL